MFKSILGRHGVMLDCADGRFPDFFHDLKLDSIIAPILRTDPSGTLRRIYLSPLDDEDVIRGREDVFRDLSDKSLLQFLDTFSLRFSKLGEQAVSVRGALSGGHPQYHRRLMESELLHLAEGYVGGVEELHEVLGSCSLISSYMTGFSVYLRDHVSSGTFRKLADDSDRLRSAFSRLRYRVDIRKGTVRVFPYDGEKDLLDEVRLLFGDLADEEAGSFLKDFSRSTYSGDVEESVMALLEETYPEEFRALHSFAAGYSDFADRTIMDFSREIRFYISWMKEIAGLEGRGLHFCIPGFSREGIHADDFFDMALAGEKGDATVPSSFRLDGSERTIVVTGPNQGGKTTFARAFGALHYLASLGLPVPGRSATLMIPDAIFTHFGREEDVMGGEGRLEDDVSRLHSILEECTERSILIINEIFSSTTAADAVELGGRMLDIIRERGAVAVVVTFLDELALHGSDVVSMVSRTSADEPGVRTYRIERGKPDGRAFALGMAKEYGLDPETLAGRLEE